MNEGRGSRLKEDVFASCQTGLEINRGCCENLQFDREPASLCLDTHQRVDDSSFVEITARAGMLRIVIASRRVVTVPSLFH